METTIVGIDCAVDEKKVGLALAAVSDSGARLLNCRTGGRGVSIVQTIAEWTRDASRTLLALDAQPALSECADSPLKCDHRPSGTLEAVNVMPVSRRIAAVKLQLAERTHSLHDPERPEL